MSKVCISLLYNVGVQFHMSCWSKNKIQVVNVSAKTCWFHSHQKRSCRWVTLGVIPVAAQSCDQMALRKMPTLQWDHWSHNWVLWRVTQRLRSRNSTNPTVACSQRCISTTFWVHTNATTPLLAYIAVAWLDQTAQRTKWGSSLNRK